VTATEAEANSATPRIDVVGLGPAGPELITTGTLNLIDRADVVFLRTGRHPSAAAFPDARTFDHHYEQADTFDQVYEAVAADVVAAATARAGVGGRGARVVYAVPGSPLVAERTVILLRQDHAVASGEVALVVHAAVSFLDLAFARLGVDPVAAAVTVVDGESFAVDAAGLSGPLLVAQCWSTAVLSSIKLSVDLAPLDSVTVLHHLGLDDERMWEVPWDELDRSFTPDHLTSLWIPQLTAPVAAELVHLDELVHTLRERCPWDREQTHGSLARHLLEESYEVLEAIDEITAIDEIEATGEIEVIDDAAEELAVAHLEEELGDLLFQVYFHTTLAAEAGRFTLADVARGIHDKLVSRHPHVFGDLTADTPGDVATNWEAIKKAEKNRTSVTEGIPAALPALSLTAKLQRKALAVGMVLPGVAEDAERVADGVARLGPAEDTSDGQGGGPGQAAEVGDLLFALVNLARLLGVDPETALRTRAAAFRSSVELHG
jgi:tetrapyrrole methylase family protein/MazG family protein